MKKIIAFFLFTISPLGFGLTVEETYRLIPHEQTTYTSSKSKLPISAKRELEELFKIVDQGVVARFSAYRKLYYSKSPKQTITNYQKALSKLKVLRVSSTLIPIKNKIVKSMEIQIKYLETWAKAQKRAKVSFNPNDPLVQESSKDLREVHNDLMSLFPNESEHNKKAFFDHLCALDFI